MKVAVIGGEKTLIELERGVKISSTVNTKAIELGFLEEMIEADLPETRKQRRLRIRNSKKK
tara:strand:- start:352 stop:534 length:183 start_codon:yes stop_codon:yes gene_type:complete